MSILFGVKKYFLWYYLLIKRLLKKQGIWLMIIVLPIIFAIYSKIQSSDDSGSMRVGLILEDSDEIAQKTVEKLINGNYSVNFYIENSKENLIDDINNEKTVCGYIFSENLTNKLDTLNIKGCINVVVPSSDFMSSMINEMVFSELFKVYGGNIAVNNIEASQLFGVYNEEAILMLQDKYLMYADSDKTFHIDFENIDEIDDNMQSDSESDVDSSSISLERMKTSNVSLFSIRGILAVIMVVAGLTGCVWWNYEKKCGMFKAMRATQCYIGAFLYITAVALITAIPTIIVIFITNSQAAGVGMEFVKMVEYIFIIGIMGTLLCFLIRDKMFLISFIPVYAVLCLVMCPVFFDISTILPAVKYVRWLLVPYYYM